MYNPKKEIFDILKELGYGVAQTQPTEFNKLPFINFEVTNNVPSYSLDNEISYQDIDIKVDIWANTSTEASRILSEVEYKMRQNLYKMTYCADVPNIGDIFHATAHFSLLIGG